MFVVLLRFADNRDNVAEFMDDHTAWLKSGFEDGVFLAAGSLQPGLGGGIVAHNTSLQELESRVNKDPFVAQNVVTAEIIDIAVVRTDPRVDFLES